ncbi:MAG: ribonuclease HI family protein [Candidatus Micrarchaeota archaeon]|nr:ribonuclease HI family protein [Candidatus Micrarchaeota archaeon]MDE1849842.1 ribonuclease HI family protein [Candidatus Micrarchaeota archaeon]
MLLTIYTDGASRSNPGESASGFQILDENSRQLLEKAFYNGIRTNNEAEYIAIIAALEAAGSLYGFENDVRIFSDSELVVKQITGAYKVKEAKLKAPNSKARALAKRFSSCILRNVPREDRHISQVDRHLNALLDDMAKKVYKAD